jgi:GxxExxY protein
MEKIKKNILYKKLSYEIVGCIYEAYNKIGSGFKESIYQNSLKIEFEEKNINFEDRPRLPIFYKNKKVGFYIPDFVIDDKIIIELKSVEFMPKIYESQLYNYLKGTKYQLGYIINFGGSKIDIRRRIYEKAANKN